MCFHLHKHNPTVSWVFFYCGENMCFHQHKNNPIHVSIWVNQSFSPIGDINNRYYIKKNNTWEKYDPTSHVDTWYRNICVGKTNKSSPPGTVRKPIETSYTQSKVIEANNSRQCHHQGQIWFQQWHGMCRHQLCIWYGLLAIHYDPVGIVGNSPAMDWRSLGSMHEDSMFPCSIHSGTSDNGTIIEGTKHFVASNKRI